MSVDLSQIIREQEGLGVNTRGYSYKQFQQLSKMAQTKNEGFMFPGNKSHFHQQNNFDLDVNMDKKSKKDIIKSLLKYNTNSHQESKKLRIIEQDFNRRYLNKIRSVDKLKVQEVGEQALNIQQYHSRQVSINKQYSSSQLQKSTSPTKTAQSSTFYHRLHNEVKSMYQATKPMFYAQQRANGYFLRSNNNHQSLYHLKGSFVGGKTSILSQPQIDPTDKVKKFIEDQSSVKRSFKKIGIYPPSPVVYKNKMGFSNHSQMKRYENIIQSFQQLALRLELNKNLLSAQRPILRTFNELHNLTVPVNSGGNILDNEEKIISYVEQRKFLQVNDVIRSLNSLQEHYEYAIYGKIQNKSMLNQSQSLSVGKDISMQYSSQPSQRQFMDGFGIVIINEQSGEIDHSSLQLYELGLELRQVTAKLSDIAKLKGMLIQRSPIVYFYNELSGNWELINGNIDQSFKFDVNTLYGIGCYPIY